MRTFRLPAAITLVLLASLALAACGSDSSSSPASLNANEKKIAAALAASISSNGGPITGEQASCIGTGVVADFGEKGMADLGVTAENAKDKFGSTPHFDHAQAVKVVNVYDRCLDLRALMLGVAPTDSAQGRATACVFKKMSDDDIRAVMVFQIEDASTASEKTQALVKKKYAQHVVDCGAGG